LSAIRPEREKLSEEEQQVKFSQLAATANAEREELRNRRALVARRRELLTELSQKREKEEISRRAEFARKQKEEEERRSIEERRRREVENAKKEIENIRTEEAKKFAQSLKEKGNIKVDINVRPNVLASRLRLGSHLWNPHSGSRRC
jgi:translation initiation factor 3 subunit A